MTGPVVLLLDIDGVINAFGADDSIAWPGGTVATGTVTFHAPGRPGPKDYRIRWAPEVPARIRAVHESGLAEVRWCTTWLHQGGTRLAEALFGLPEFADGYDANGVESHRVAKLTAALDVLASGRRLIWCDDDAIPWRGAGGDRLSAAVAESRALLIDPWDVEGLRPWHLDVIDAFTREGT